MQVTDWNQFVISQVYGMLERANVIDGLSTEQMSVMLQLPVECLKQMYHPRQSFDQQSEELRA